MFSSGGNRHISTHLNNTYLQLIQALRIYFCVSLLHIEMFVLWQAVIPSGRTLYRRSNCIAIPVRISCAQNRQKKQTGGNTNADNETVTRTRCRCRIVLMQQRNWGRTFVIFCVCVTFLPRRFWITSNWNFCLNIAEYILERYDPFVMRNNKSWPSQESI